MMLTKFPNCRDAAVAITRARIAAWRTSQGIGLGSGKTAILHAYGAPLQRWWIHRGNPAVTHIGPADTAKPIPGKLMREWGYGSQTDLRFVHFGFEGARAALIFIGNNE